jgi:Flp pilus assembly protein TadD
MTHFARALGATRIGELGKATTSIDSLNGIQQRLAAKNEPYLAEQVAIHLLGAEAWLELARGHSGKALELMSEAATREDATEKSAYSPGPLAPARELLGDMLQQLGRSQEARAAYELVLQREPNRRRSLAALGRQVATN